ncbi:hypothetical protein [Streptomyces sp. NRRL F-2580]|uniref:hypothetical protein n=1 Tax=Streptomyces sp. NRRL F-2580 TaxID=1463841 RepID=UPI0004C7D99E|nr:hypothetical protein [Streptomyces sp. NRRL F-2580]
MNDETVPPLWFQLPPGFHTVSSDDRHALECMADALESAEARTDVTRLMGGLDGLSGHHVVHTSIGLHPDDVLGVSTSFFSLTVRPAQHPNSGVAVAQTSLAISRSALWCDATRTVIELPSSLPCYLVAGLISLPGADNRLFQARAITAHAQGRRVLILDLTSAAIGNSEAYTSILEAITYTIAFSDPDPDPEASPPPPAATSRILEVLL